MRWGVQNFRDVGQRLSSHLCTQSSLFLMETWVVPCHLQRVEGGGEVLTRWLEGRVFCRPQPASVSRLEEEPSADEPPTLTGGEWFSHL